MDIFLALKIILLIVALYRGWLLWPIVLFALPYLISYGIAFTFMGTGDINVLNTYAKYMLAANIVSLVSLVSLIYMALTPNY